MDKITGELIQNGTPTPYVPVPIERYYKAIINGKEFIFRDDLNIEEIYKKDGKWYVRKG